MEVKLSIKCLVDGEGQELKFGVEDGKLVLINDSPQQSDNDQVEDVGQSEEKENAPVVQQQHVIVRDSMTIVNQEDTMFKAKANTLYSFGNPIDSLAVTLEKPEDTGKVEEYIFVFTTSENFKFKDFVAEDGKHVLYPTDFVLNNSTTYVLSVMYVGRCYIVNENPYL